MKNPLTTQRYTRIEHEDDFKYNAPHHFKIIQVAERADFPEAILTEIHMQEGPIKECGSNGCFNEDLLAIVLMRLEAFQNSDYRCRENAIAITKLEEALMWLRKRTTDREARGVMGTSAI